MAGGVRDNRDGDFGGDRGFIMRASDEVRSWFGDEEADWRRHMDERADPRHAYHYHSPEETGSGFGNQYGSQLGRGAQAVDPARRHHLDDNYRAWRDMQMARLDRDYEEFRRYRQSRFDREFEEWLYSQARAIATTIREHQDVLGSDGVHVGAVDKVEGDEIKLTRREDGRHRFLPLSMVIAVDDKVRLDCPAEDARRRWRTEADPAA